MAEAYGVPRDEAHGGLTPLPDRGSHKDEAVAGVEHEEVTAVGVERREGGGGGRGGEPRIDSTMVLEEAEQRRGRGGCARGCRRGRHGRGTRGRPAAGG